MKEAADHDAEDQGAYLPGPQRNGLPHSEAADACNSQDLAFLLYIEKVLVPTLRRGDIVIMDNLGSHKASAVRRAVRAAGARLFYLPKILARSEPDRAVLLKAQTLAAQSRSANNRDCLLCYRTDPADGLIGRMRQLLRQRRI